MADLRAPVPLWITVVGCCGTGAFLEILVPAPGLPGLGAAPACSRVPGEPLRSALLWSRRARLLSLVPTRGDAEAPAFRLSRIDLPIRKLSELIVPAVGLRVPGLLEAEMDGVLLVIELPMREVRPDELPTLEILPELAADCLVAVEADGLSIRIELLPLGREPGAGLSMRMELPMREVLSELIRLRVLGVDRLDDEDTDGVLVPIERPMLDLVLVAGLLADEETDGLLVVIELPMRVLLLGLIRVLELLLTEVEPVELLLTETLDEGLRELEGLVTVIRLDVEPLGLRLDEIELERLGVDLLIDILLELLRLGVDLLTDNLEELLLRLGTDRLEVIVLDRLGVGALLIDDLLELLRLDIDRLGLRLTDIELDRLGVDLLTDVLLELLRVGVDRLRLADIELDRLGVGARRGVGARLTDDLLGLLRVGAGARLGAAGLAA